MTLTSECNSVNGLKKERIYQRNLQADIYFSDEANGGVNRHKAVYWANENRHQAAHVYSQINPMLNVWCGIHRDVVFLTVRSLLKSVDVLRKHYYPIWTICP